MIIIESNGSKWAGQDPDPIEKLFEMLANYPLNRIFERYGNFITENPINVQLSWNDVDEETGKLCKYYLASDEQSEPGTVHFSGNFFNYSHVFSIRTTNAKLIEELSKAIRANQTRADYLAQDEPGEPQPYYIVYKDGTKERKLI